MEQRDALGESKREVRARVRARLKQLSPAYIRKCSEDLLPVIGGILRSTAGALNICLYAPMRGELDFTSLVRAFPQHRCYFPCIEDEQLAFYRVKDEAEDLRRGQHNFLEPRREEPCLDPSEAHLVLVPGLAFTEDGDRLGRGGGYYDRFLKLCPGAMTLGAAMEEQIFPFLPVEAHDQRVHRVLVSGRESMWVR